MLLDNCHSFLIGLKVEGHEDLWLLELQLLLTVCRRSWFPLFVVGNGFIDDDKRGRILRRSYKIRIPHKL
jgi:hypothetical protein